MGKFGDNAMSGIVWDEVSIEPGTLQPRTAMRATSKIDAGRLQGFRVLRTEYFIVLRGVVIAFDNILVGLAADLSIAEIKEAIEADPQRSNDPNLSEQAKRPLWPLELMGAASVTLNGNLYAKGVHKLGWSIPEGVSLFWFVFNMDDIDQLTTGLNIQIIAKHFGVWLKD